MLYKQARRVHKFELQVWPPSLPGEPEGNIRYKWDLARVALHGAEPKDVSV